MEEVMDILSDPYSSEDLYDLAMLYFLNNLRHPSKPRSKNNLFRKVVKMSELIQKYGSLFSRAYRMSVENFYCLHNILEKHLTDMFDVSRSSVYNSVWGL